MKLNREQWLDLAKANAEALRGEIEKLRQALLDETPDRYRHFWNQARDLSSRFRSYRPIEAEERQGLWAEFRAICEATRTVMDSERASMAASSRALREELESAIGKAESALALAHTLPELARVQGMLNEVLNRMKSPKRKAAADLRMDGSEAAESQSSEQAPPAPEDVAALSSAAEAEAPLLLKEDRRACWSKWVAVREAVKNRHADLRKEVAERLRGQAEEILEAAEADDPLAVQARVKAAQSELKASGLPPKDQESIRQRLRASWKRCSERIAALRDVRAQSREDWLQRMKGHLMRWESLLQRNRVLEAQLRAQVGALQKEAESSVRPEEGQKLHRWMEGKASRLRSLEAANRELQDKIASVRAKLGSQAPPPPPEPDPAEIAAAIRVEPFARRGNGTRQERDRERDRDREREPAPPPGLNLGEILAKELGLTPRSGE
jgi:hypothetical protein